MEKHITIRAIQKDTILVVEVQGEIISPDAIGFDEDVMRLVASYSDIAAVSVDFKNVDYLDSAGMGAIISLKKDVERNGMKFTIININERILYMIKMAGIDEYFNL